MTTQKITLGFSPCPNDCFMFDALIHNKIDTEGLSFDVVMTDVEELNKKAFAGELDVTKLSYNAYTKLTQHYILLDAGSALGNNCGPLLISKKELAKESITPDTLIAIPGKNTTANFLFTMALPQAKNKKEYLFSDIEKAVLNEEVEAGVIIHENRFTYQDKGLKKIMDLGEYWEQQTHTPIPLGGIVIKRNFSLALQLKINSLIKKSVEFAFANPESSKTFVKQHAQEMSEDVMRKHIDLYVNQYSLSLGEKGRKAVELFFEKSKELNLVSDIKLPLIVN